MTWGTAAVAFGGTLLVVGVTSRLSERAPMSPVIGALGIGLVLGPHGLGVWSEATGMLAHRVLERIAELAVALAVTDIALRFGGDDVARPNRRRVARLLGLGMPGMWGMGTLGAHVALGLPWRQAVLVAAIITPTDPAVANVLTSGALADRLLPQRLRASLQLESGANDGLGIAFVILGVLLVAPPGGGIPATWAAQAVRAVGVALVLGPALGWATGRLACFASRVEAIDESYVPLLGIAMTGVAVGGADLAGASSALTAFVAGLVLRATLPEDLKAPVSRDQEAFSKLMLVGTFVGFGVMLPWGTWAQLGPPALGFCLWVLVLRRPPVVPLVLLGDDTGPRSTALLAAYGPLGAAAIYYALDVERRLPAPVGHRVWVVVALAVTASVVVHTGTAAAAVRFFGRSAGTRDDPRMAETPGTVEGGLP